jgi:tetrahydromethanopterin S-methyltransferase subunit B
MSTSDAPGRPLPRRLDTFGPGTADLAGVRLTIGSLLRWSPLIVVASLLGWAVGSSTPDVGRTHSATVTLALTDEVVWPFYDAVVAHQPELLTDGGALAAAEARTGLTADDVTFDLDTGQTNAVIRLVVEADTEAHAVELADALAETMIASNLDEQRRDIELTIDQLSEQLDDRRTRLDELTARRDVERYSGDAPAAELTQSAAQVVSDEISGLEGQLSDASAELGNTQPRIEVVAAATPGRNRSNDVKSDVVVAALFGLIAVALIPTLDRRLARVRSAGQLKRIWPAVPVLDERHGSELLGRTTLDAVEHISDEGRRTVTVLALDEAAADALATMLETSEAADATAVVTPSADASFELLAADAIVLVVDRGATSVRRLEQIADDLVALDVSPRAIVLARR